MKIITLFTLLCLSYSTIAAYSKPELLARLSDRQAYRAPDNTWCFTSEPTLFKGRVYLGCLDENGYFMASFGNDFKYVARAADDQYFSYPLISQGKLHWHEYNEFQTQRSYQLADSLKVTDIKNLGPLSEANDSFLPLGNGQWFFRVKNESPELRIWKNGKVIPFFNPQAAYIFTPQIGEDGEIAFKTREGNYNETSPDRIWLFDGSNWKVVLEDREANPSSPWISLRHQLSVEGNKVLVVAKDAQGEALIVTDGESTKVIARVGRDLKAIDFFTPKMKNGIIAFRAVDKQNRKALYVYEQGQLKPLLTEGDTVKTDVGLGRVYYQSKDAIFYGAPGIAQDGTIIQQATLTDADSPSTLLGVGLIKFHK